MLFQKILIVRSTSSPPFFFSPFYDYNLFYVLEIKNMLQVFSCSLFLNSGSIRHEPILYIYKVLFLYVYDG